MKTFFQFSLFLILSISHAQVYELTGVVTENQKVAPDVKVRVVETDQQVFSDQNGAFNLQLEKGHYNLIFEGELQKHLAIQMNKNKTLTIELNDAINTLDAVFLSSVRVDADSPITFSNLDKNEIRKRNLGQDIPILMEHLPNVVSTSDAGAGIGYTGIRVRGSDATRVNVTINGVPLNDAESHSTIWVNLGDFSSSVESLQLQRGVGTSSNGAGAFGASLNVLTENPSKEAEVEITNTYGSFNTHKHQVQFNSGLLNDKFNFSGNFSTLNSDGYRDRAFSDLTSYLLQGSYQEGNTSIKALTFGGSEKTYQAYYGVSPEQMKENRRYNPAGEYTDAEGNRQFYDNQTDNYKQDHFHLTWNQRYSSEWSSNLAFYHTYGKGYYESYKENASLTQYGLPEFIHNGELHSSSDLINQKWLKNHLYGALVDLHYKRNAVKAVFGGGINYYDGDHYGKVMYTEFAENPTPFGKYYDNVGTKKDLNVFAKLTWAIDNNWSFFGDLQARFIDYNTEGPYDGQELEVKDNFSFFNPKAGITYKWSDENRLYFSFAMANREPTRSDYKGAVLGNENPVYPRAEKLKDFEFGWRHDQETFKFNSNLYLMDYTDQLVLTGKIDPEGRFIRENSGESLRLGLEVDATIDLNEKFSLAPNVAISRNKNKNYKTDSDGQIKEYGNTQISFSPNIVAGNRLEFHPDENLTIGFLSKFVGAQYMSNTEDKASKLDSYLVHDLSAQYHWKKAPLFKEVVFTGLINNIFNEKYVSNGSFSESSGPYYYPQAGINFLTGISLRF